MKQSISFLVALHFLNFWNVTAFAAPIRIGIVTDLSGPMASWGQQTRLGAQIAAEELRNDGHQVELLLEDHQLSPKVAVTEVQKLLFVDHVSALYSEFTPTSIAIAPLTKNSKTLFIYAAAATSVLELSPYAFKTYWNYSEACRLVAESWKKKGYSSVAILKANLEFGDLCETGARQVYPELIEETYNPGEQVRSQLLALKSKRVRAILNVTFEPDMLNMLQAVDTLQYQGEIGANSDSVAAAVRKAFPKLLPQLVTFDIAPPKSAFLEKVHARDPTNSLVSISAAGLAYAHVKQLVLAVISCETKPPEDRIHCEMEKLSQATAVPEIGFIGWKNRVAQLDLRLSR